MEEKKTKVEPYTNVRYEQDCIGIKRIPIDAYYGMQTARAAENFTITGHPMHPEFIVAMAEVKKAAAITNAEVGALDKERADAIIKACDEIIEGKLHEQFITDQLQGGAGTSFNMNANEVIANRAIELMGGEIGDYTIVHPNDHVNCGQSTNDVFPSCGRITFLRMLDAANAELERLHHALNAKADEFDHIIKMGRTQLQDAVPIRLGQSFRAYATAISRDISRFARTKSELRELNLGGTAIGTGLNANPEYIRNVVGNLAKVTGIDYLAQASDLIDATQNTDGFVSVSGVVKSCVMTLSKISNDLRLMSSGPQAGFSEINLPPRQCGSSIMPGKVNPVIPEVVNQVSFNIIGNDLTITMAAEAGQLELNAFEPIIFYKLYQSLDTLKNAIRTLVDNCVVDITANEEYCRNKVESSVGIITAVNPYIGYSKASDIATEAIVTRTSVKEIILREKLLSEEELEKILDPHAMTEWE